MSATKTPSGLEPATKFIPGAKATEVPVPIFLYIVTLFVFETAISGLPSPSKSDYAIPFGFVIDGRSTFGLKKLFVKGAPPSAKVTLNGLSE